MTKVVTQTYIYIYGGGTKFLPYFLHRRFELYVYVSICFTPIVGEVADLDNAQMWAARMDALSAMDFSEFLGKLGFEFSQELQNALQTEVRSRYPEGPPKLAMGEDDK